MRSRYWMAPKKSRHVRSLLKDADVFFSNRRPGYLERYDLRGGTQPKKPGLITAKVVLHGNGSLVELGCFDETALPYRAFSVSKAAYPPQIAPIIPICDNVVGCSARGRPSKLCARAEQGGSYRVTVSLTRTVLWLLSLASSTRLRARNAGSTEEHATLLLISSPRRLRWGPTRG